MGSPIQEASKLEGPKAGKSNHERSDDSRDNNNNSNSITTGNSNRQQDLDRRSTPQSQSSSNSTNSSGQSKGSNNTTSMSKFKEKRPEPLKLNPNLNQEIPLDLSVKSAGNVPSGNVFNLSSAGAMTTLETPRIAWQDNEALLIKRRLVSSSTNNSQRLQISSITSDSPPITPNTPLMDLLCSPSARSLGNGPRSAGLLYDSSLLSSLQQAPKSAQFQYTNTNKHHMKLIDDTMNRYVTNTTTATVTSQASKLTPTNRFLVHHHLTRASGDLIKGPRRSCSTESLSSNASFSCTRTTLKLLKYHHHQQQQQQIIIDSRNLVSPLVTKNLSSSTTSGPDRFSYTNSTSNVPLECNGSIDKVRERESSNLTPGSLSPTSVASATANLCNIHLHSPTTAANNSTTTSGGQLIDSTLGDLLTKQVVAKQHNELDPLLSAVYCQQQQQQQQQQSTHQLRSDNSGNRLDKLNLGQSYLLNQITSASSGSVTLDTPTLISPSQLKTNSISCFLPSPILSPMSSMFEMPSPLLVFPPAPTCELPVSVPASMSMSISMSATPKRRLIEESSIYTGGQQASGRGSSLSQQVSPISHIITPARDKVGASLTGETEVRMEVDEEEVEVEAESENVNVDELVVRDSKQVVISDEFVSTNCRSDGTTKTVGQAIPKILVSDCLIQQQQQQPLDVCSNWLTGPRQATFQPLEQQLNRSYNSHQQPQRVQRSSSAKRALSPQSFRNRVDHYHSDRLESCSAPPDVHQAQPRSARAKIKSVTVEPCINPLSAELTSSVSYSPSGSGLALNSGANFSTSGDGGQERGNNGHHYKLVTNVSYLEQQQQPRALHQRWLPANSNPSIATNSSYTLANRPLVYGARPSSAEPASLRNYANVILPVAQSSAQPNQHLHLQQQQHQQQHVHAHEPLCATNQHWDSLRLGDYSMLANGGNLSQSAQHLRCASALDYHHSSSGKQQEAGYSSSELAGHQQQLVSTSDSELHHQTFHECSSTTARQQEPAELELLLNQVGGNLANLTAAQGQAAIVVQQQQQQHQLHHHIHRQPRAFSADGLAGSGQPGCESSCSGSIDFGSVSSRSSSAALPGSTNLGGSGAKKYHCDQCSKAFTRSDMLTRHKRLHSGDRPFQCNECKQEFSRSDHLSTHMRTHTGEKPYKCKMCSYSACRKDMITRHMKVHNRSSPNANATETAR